MDGGADGGAVQRGQLLDHHHHLVRGEAVQPGRGLVLGRRKSREAVAMKLHT